MCALLGEPQSLVSYHLGRLRSEGMVFSRRSDADGRDTYYGADLDRCRELLSASAAALHPGLTMQRASVPEWGRDREQRPSVLFLCTGNSSRSQIAEALATHLSGGTVKAVSAGSHPKPLHADAVLALAERGIDVSDRTSKHLSRFTSDQFDYVVTLCDRVREECPEFPGHPDVIHWSVPDPSRGAAGQDSYQTFARTLAEIERRVDLLLAVIASERRS